MPVVVVVCLLSYLSKVPDWSISCDFHWTHHLNHLSLHCVWVGSTCCPNISNRSCPLRCSARASVPSSHPTHNPTQTTAFSAVCFCRYQPTLVSEISASRIDG